MIKTAEDTLILAMLESTDPWLITVTSQDGQKYEQPCVPVYVNDGLARKLVAEFRPTVAVKIVVAELCSPYGDTWVEWFRAFNMINGDTLQITWTLK
jgi:hypothetical protein